MKYSFKIGSIWGVPIELHLTFILLIAAVFIFAILNYLSWYTFVLVLFLFVFVYFHELSHSIVARHYNITVRRIVLYPIGGVSEIDEIPDNPRIEWRVAIAGPLASFIIGAVLLVLNLLVPVQTPVLQGFIVTGNFLFILGALNIILGGFNLIPAFPMDGGRVFRALLAERMKFTDATRYAANIGKIFGILFAIFGFVFNPWLIIIGLLIYVGANEEVETTIVSTSLATVRVSDVMIPEKGVATPQTTLSEAVEIMLKSRYHDILVENNGIFQGIVVWDDIMRIKPDQRSTERVEGLPLKKISIFPDESVLEANKIMSREKIDLLAVIDRNSSNKVIGVVTNESLTSAVEKSKKPK